MIEAAGTRSVQGCPIFPSQLILYNPYKFIRERSRAVKLVKLICSSLIFIIFICLFSLSDTGRVYFCRGSRRQNHVHFRNSLGTSRTFTSKFHCLSLTIHYLVYASPRFNKVFLLLLYDV